MNRLPTPKGVTRLRNTVCPYCGADLTSVPSDEDHVIARRLVPKGSLAGGWNLILRACKPCNNKKSDLEDDLSAISMQAGPFGDLHAEDAVLKVEAERKAKAISRRTGKPVAESHERIRFEGRIGPGFDISFDLVTSPQLDRQRAAELALFQLQAFFFFLTYNEQERSGRAWIGDTLVVNMALRQDWGNSYQRTFIASVSNWDYRLIVTTASGYYRGTIRKHPEHDSWAFLIEINRNLRIVGFFGDPATADAETAKLTPPAVKLLQGKDPNHRLAFRAEIPIDEDPAGPLFEIPVEEPPAV